MKKKNKRKSKQKKRKFKKKIKRLKKIKKIRKKIKIPQFKEQRKRLKKITFQKVLDLLLEPVFRAYENFREKRKLEKLKKISIEKKERERAIKEERRLRYEAKRQELRDEIKFAKERELDLKKFISSIKFSFSYFFLKSFAQKYLNS